MNQQEEETISALMVIGEERVRSMVKGGTDRSRAEAQKSSQSNRGIGDVAGAGEVVVAAAMVVVAVAEDVDGTDDRRSNVSQLAVGGGGAAGAGCCWCWKFRRCETGGGRGGRCCARGLAWPLPLALAFLARMASSVSTYFCTRFSCEASSIATVRSSDEPRREILQRSPTGTRLPAFVAAP